MRCDNCPGLLKEGYEYPEGYCFYGVEPMEFSDGTQGCRRRSREKIRKDIKKEWEEWNKK